jgi:hypothetical protein
MKSKKGKAGQERGIKTFKQFEQFREDYGHRCIFKAMGFTSRELALPRIAVVNSWSEQSPGHVHLRAISEGVKAGIRMAGGMPFEINVIGPCTMLGKTTLDVAHYDLPQREAILASIESALHVGWCDGWVGIGSCDKIIPGMMLAALRLNRPFIFIGGGQMIPSEYEGKNIGYVDGQEIMIRELRKLQDVPHLIEAYVDFVMLGCPHYSVEQVWEVCKLLKDRRIHSHTNLWIFTPRALKEIADRNGYTDIITSAGGILITDTCPALAQVLPKGTRVAATDSAKQAHYLPPIMGVQTWFGST